MPTPLDAIVGLARSAGLVLGLPAGELEAVRPGPPLARLGERLAERNLGLVRVRDADSFAWPGHWLGIVEVEEGGRRAVVLFGVPSAIVEAPGAGHSAPERRSSTAT